MAIIENMLKSFEMIIIVTCIYGVSAIFAKDLVDHNVNEQCWKKDIKRDRNVKMIKRIESTLVEYPFCFTIAGDTSATVMPPSLAQDQIFCALLSAMEQLNPRPVFFVSLGDFSGPGTLIEHHRYLNIVNRSSLPDLAVIGNHDLDDKTGWDNFHNIYGTENYSFEYGNTSFIVINSHCNNGLGQPAGPRKADLVFLESSLKKTHQPLKIVFMHMPPNFNEHYEPQSDWGFKNYEEDFLKIIKQYGVKLVCCAHVIAYDYYVYEGVAFVTSGGGGWGVDTRYRNRPPLRGSFYHFVQVLIDENGCIKGQIYRAYRNLQIKPDLAYSFELQ